MAPQKILVPVDGSNPSLAALDHAMALAGDGGQVVMLHVAAEGPQDSTASSLAAPTPSERDALGQRLDDAFTRSHDQLGARVLRRDERGDPLRTILEIARDERFDLIVMGTHGRVGRLHAILGSVAEGVVRNAPCPVLTVREPGAGYESFAEKRHGRPSVSQTST